MAVEVHVTGRVELGRFSEFLEAAGRWRELRAQRESAPCLVLQGLSGEMNLVRMVFTYPDAAAFEEEEARDAADPEYGRAASAMPFVDGTLSYELYRVRDLESDNGARALT